MHTSLFDNTTSFETELFGYIRLLQLLFSLTNDSASKES